MTTQETVTYANILEHAAEEVARSKRGEPPCESCLSQRKTKTIRFYSLHPDDKTCEKYGHSHGSGFLIVVEGNLGVIRCKRCRPLHVVRVIEDPDEEEGA